MIEPHTKAELLLARIAVALIVGLSIAGVLWYGLCTEELARVWRNIVARPGGPMTFRFVLQPLMGGLRRCATGLPTRGSGARPICQRSFSAQSDAEAACGKASCRRRGSLFSA